MFAATASRIAWRELRASPSKFVFVIIAVAIGVGALSGVKGFGIAFKSMLLRNTKQLIAADLQAQTWNFPSADQVRRIDAIAHQRGQVTQVTETISMARAGQDRVPQMVAVKAVDPSAYPFYGNLTIVPARPLPQLLTDSTVVVTPELLLRLKTKVGGVLRLGGEDFTIAGELQTEPDRLASGFGPGMRVLMSRGGLERTHLIQFGSRAAQRFLFKLDPHADLDAMKADIKAILPRVYISDFREGDPAVGKSIDQSTTFLSLVSLIALIVGSLGVAMAMYSHLQQRMDTIAVMKAVGARSQQIISIYLIQTLWLGLAGGLIGVAIGAAVQKAFPVLIERVFSLLPEVSWDWSFSIEGMSVGILATLLFTLPPLIGIRNVRPSLVFRRDMADAASEAQQNWRSRIPAALLSILILGGWYSIAVWLSGSWKMGFYFITGLSGSILLLGLIAALLLALMRWLVRAQSRAMPSWLRHGFANLYRPGNQARAVLVALGVGVMFTLTTYLVQNTVLRDVSSEGPGRSGNLFLLDVRNSPEVVRLIESQPGVSGKVQLVGYIVVRMLEKNGIVVDQLPLTTERKNQLQTIRITTAEEKPESLEVREGRWWTPHTQQMQLAASEEAVRWFGLKLGDRLQFQAAGKTVDAPVVALFRRSARAPIRYDIVGPGGAMLAMPLVYYGAVRVDPASIPRVEEKLFDRFPAVTVMNLADVLKRIQEAVDQVALVIRFLAAFAILAGIIILASSVAGTRYRRIREVAILKTLGATRSRITAIFSVEFSVLGIVAGMVGGLLANLFTRVISSKFLEASYDFDWTSFVVVILGTAILANLAGWLASSRILDQRPLEVLRGE